MNGSKPLPCVCGAPQFIEFCKSWQGTRICTPKSRLGETSLPSNFIDSIATDSSRSGAAGATNHPPSCAPRDTSDNLYLGCIGAHAQCLEMSADGGTHGSCSGKHILQFRITSARSSWAPRLHRHNGQLFRELEGAGEYPHALLHVLVHETSKADESDVVISYLNDVQFTQICPWLTSCFTYT